MLSLNQINKGLSNFASAHGQVNYYGSGQVFDFATSGTTTYPAMWTDIEPSNLSGGVFITSVRVYFLDRLLKGGTNLFEVMSDMQLVALDLIAHLKSNYYYPQTQSIIITDSISLNPVFESFHDDEIAGWYMDLEFKSEFQENRCQIPFNTSILLNQ